MVPIRVLGVSAAIAVACSSGREPVAAPGEPLPGLSQADLAQFRAGLVQFNRVFTPEEGLGPLFNENQCSACHTDPAPGGTGGTKVLKGTRFTPPDTCDRLETSGGENVRRQATPAARAAGITAELLPPHATGSTRLTPTALYGLGLVEAIPDDAILARADPDDADGDGISGRPGRNPNGALGRFGRKAEAATLLEFSDGALRFEMGLTTPETPVESGYQGGPLPAGIDPSPEPEVDDTVVAQLIAFMRFLAPPERGIRDAAHRDSVEQGERIFRSLGCGSCHVRAMTTGPSPIAALDRKTVALYSDLLLHDMGPRAADICGIGAAPSEVRTEMLMGLQHRREFLHDGRAGTVEDAILLHGGEAERARNAFARLGPRARLVLLVFLRSL